jgi:hypothetical protein
VGAPIPDGSDDGDFEDGSGEEEVRGEGWVVE